MVLTFARVRRCAVQLVLTMAVHHACHHSSLLGKAQIAWDHHIITHVFHGAASWLTGVEAGRVAIQSVCRAAARDNHALPPRTGSAHVVPRACQAPQQPGAHPWHAQVWVSACTAARHCVKGAGLTWSDSLLHGNRCVVHKGHWTDLGRLLLHRSREWCDHQLLQIDGIPCPAGLAEAGSSPWAALLPLGSCC